MKFIVFSLIFANCLYASTCYTAVNGFIAVGQVAGQYASSMATTIQKLNDLNIELNNRNEKLEKLNHLQISILTLKAKNYVKSKAVIHYLKQKNDYISIDSNVKIIEEM